MPATERIAAKGEEVDAIMRKDMKRVLEHSDAGAHIRGRTLCVLRAFLCVRFSCVYMVTDRSEWRAYECVACVCV